MRVVAGAGEVMLGLLLVTARGWRAQLSELSAWLILAFSLGNIGGDFVSPGSAAQCGCFGAVRLGLWQHLLVNAVLMVISVASMHLSSGETEDL